MSTRLKLAVIGLGQCGGNLANTFAKHGYPAMAVNTSILDLKELANIPENRRIYAPLNDSDGAGKDPRIGENALHLHTTNILTQAHEFVQGADAILLTSGLGGGTGSNVAFLGNLLRRFNLPILIMSTLPTNTESALSKINALRSINKLVAENFDSCILIDNEKILSQFPDSNLSTFYPQANEYAVRTFTHFNSLSTEFASKSLISFDNEDFRKVLFSRGILIYGETEIAATEISTLDEILPQLKLIWENGGLMAEGYNFTSAAVGAISFYAPSEILQKTSSRFLNQLGEDFKALTNGATCYFGLYETPPGTSTVKISSMLGRLSIPIRLQEMLAGASSEGQNLKQKINQELPTLDISALEDMELFSNRSESRSVRSLKDTAILARSEITAATTVVLENRPYSPEEYVRLKKSST